MTYDAALVCKREINGEQGNATVWMVRLRDGFLIDCGLNETRARALAAVINEVGCERLSNIGLAA